MWAPQCVGSFQKIDTKIDRFLTRSQPQRLYQGEPSSKALITDSLLEVCAHTPNLNRLYTPHGAFSPRKQFLSFGRQFFCSLHPQLPLPRRAPRTITELGEIPEHLSYQSNSCPFSDLFFCHSFVELSLHFCQLRLFFVQLGLSGIEIAHCRLQPSLLNGQVGLHRAQPLVLSPETAHGSVCHWLKTRNIFFFLFFPFFFFFCVPP